MSICVARTKFRQQGQSLVELAAGLIIIIPVILVCIDLATLYMGVQLNDSVCRDAARAASVGAPDAITAGEPLRRAQGVVGRANAASGAVQIDPNAVTVNETITSLPDKTYGGPVAGQVTVTTTVKIFPAFLLSLMAAGQGQSFSTNKTFAYTWQQQPSTKMVVPNGAGTSY